MKVPTYIEQILHTLNKNGHKSYLVGGCVRDSFLNKKPNDYDVCTSATPDQVKILFDKVIPTGEKHGTVTIILDEQTSEITTMRRDGIYKDARRPETVEFTNDINDDLARRDFTINAIASDIEKVYDPLNGIKDLQNKIIKAVGNPDDRFNEDALRMLRGVRFACQLKFEIDDNLKHSIKRNSSLIQKISFERIRDELCKILVSNHPSYGIGLLNELGLLEYILPELKRSVGFEQCNPHHDKDVFYHTLSVIENVPNSLKLRLGALFHDIAKPLTFSLDDNGVGHFYNHHIVGMDMTVDIMKRLRFDNNTISLVSILVKEHMTRYQGVKKPSLKRLIKRVGIENIYDLFELQISDIKGSKSPHDYSDILKTKQIINEILNEKEPLNIKDIDVNGKDLIEIGFREGKEIGIILKDIFDQVIEDKLKNEKQFLIEYALSKYIK